MTYACQLGASNQRNNIRQIYGDLVYLNVYRKKTERRGFLAGGRPLVHRVNFKLALFFPGKKFNKNFFIFFEVLSSIQIIMPSEVILPEAIDSCRESISLWLPPDARSWLVC